MHVRFAPTAVSARLLGTTAACAATGPTRSRVYCPLVVGHAVLARPDNAAGPWRVPLVPTSPLTPRTPATAHELATHLLRLRDQGWAVRLAAALLAPGDVRHVGRDLAAAVRRRNPRRAARHVEFYGWALMYRLDDRDSHALVDRHDEFADLPAFYESPAELADRAAFLEHRGIATRPLAVVTQPQDFDVDDGLTARNRYVESAAWRQDWLPVGIRGE